MSFIIDIVAYFFLTFLFLLVAHWVVKLNPFYKKLLQEQKESRYECLDGLRGFLALGVFFAHGLVTQQYYSLGRWTIPPEPFYATLAEVSVALFFMISAFLFWGKVLDAGSGVAAWRLYRSRFKRLAPMYIFSVALVFLVVAIRSNFELNVTVLDLMKQGISWLSFGFLGSPPPDINGLKDTYTIESVYWTLTFEWEFYLLLPILSRLPYKTPSVIVLMFAAGYLASLLIPVGIVTACFGLGALSAYLMRSGKVDGYIKKSDLFNVLAILVLTLVLLGFNRGHGIYQYSFVFIFFILILQGNDLFGLLRSKIAKLLGTISYSIYLIHNIVLYLIFYNFNKVQDVQGISFLTFWGLMAVAGIVTILISCLTYRYIEHPPLAKRSSHYSLKNL